MSFSSWWESNIAGAKNTLGIETTRQAEERRAALQLEYQAMRADLLAEGVSPGDAEALAEIWYREARLGQEGKIGPLGWWNNFRRHVAETGVVAGSVMIAIGGALQVIPGIGTVAGAVVALAGLAARTHGEIEAGRLRDEAKRREKVLKRLSEAKENGNVEAMTQLADDWVKNGGDPQILMNLAAVVDAGEMEYREALRLLREAMEGRFETQDEISQAEASESDIPTVTSPATSTGRTPAAVKGEVVAEKSSKSGLLIVIILAVMFLGK